MIVVKLQGRLGNQLFQYAFAKNLANKCSTFFTFDVGYNGFTIHKYFRINLFEHLISRIINHPFFRLFKTHILKKHTVVVDNIIERAEKILSHPLNNTKYEGYFQSIIYFRDIEQKIKEALIIKRKYKQQFQKKYAKVFSENKVLVVHYRGTDYINHGSDLIGGKNLTLPWSYYKKCINNITDIKSYKILVISDSLDAIKPFFADYENVAFESNSEIIDFQILTNAHTLIISNSTFAWWGAYLNKKNPVVFAPKYWLGFKVNIDYPNEILTGLNWKLIKVLD